MTWKHVSRNSLLILMLLTGISVFTPTLRAEMSACSPQTPNDMNCSCDLHSLRPLQGAIGMGEARDKAAKIAKKPTKEMQDLADDPIKTVRGPDGSLFITDHHHGARAWLLAGFSHGICTIQLGPSPDDLTAFWSELQARHLVRLADKDGNVITPDALPKMLEQMPDDPYRTLAWLVRKNDGFCRSLMQQKEFAEFLWADWMRRRPELPAAQVTAAPEKMLTSALKLVESPAAADQLGYRGDKPQGFTCPKDE